MKTHPKRFWILAGIGIVALLFVFYLVFSSRVIGQKTFPAHLAVGDIIGFNLDAGRIDFGRGAAGDTIFRTLDVTNSYSIPVLAQIRMSPSLAAFIIAQPGKIRLQPNQTAAITLIAQIPDNTPDQDLNGTIQVEFIRT